MTSHCVALSSLALALCGCAGYRLGPTTGEAPGARSIQVNAFVNQVMEPRLTEAVTTSVRRQLQQDGTFRLSTHGDGDIILNGTITDYDRANLSFDPQDIVTPRDYRLTIMTQVIARERLTGKVLLDRKIGGYTLVRVVNDLPSAERQAIPLAASDLARNLTALLVDGEW